MTARLKGRRILVAEDEYLLAREMAEALEDAGASILGPVATLNEAKTLLEDRRPPDAAVLDVSLRGIPIFPLADILVQTGVPIVFATGYDPHVLPERFGLIQKFGKPIDMESLTHALEQKVSFRLGDIPFNLERSP